MHLHFPLHAHFACLPCRARGLDPSCPTCGRPCLDLRTDEPTAWPGLAAHRAGLSLLSPRGILHRRSLLMTAAVLAAVNALAPVLGPLLDRGEVSGAELAIGAGVGLVLLPLLFPFYAGYLFAFAHVTRVLSMLVAALPLPFFRLRQNLVAWLLGLPARWWLPQLAAPFVGPAATDTRATLAAPWTVCFVRDGLSYLERLDAWIEEGPSLRAADGSVATLAVARGSLSYPVDGGERLDGAPEPPGWLQAPGRPGVRFRRVFPAGTAVAWRREGERVDLRVG